MLGARRARAAALFCPPVKEPGREAGPAAMGHPPWGSEHGLYVVDVDAGAPRDAWIQCIHGCMVRIQLFYKYPTTRIQYPIVSAVLAKYPQNPDTYLPDPLCHTTFGCEEEKVGRIQKIFLRPNFFLTLGRSN